MVCTELDCAIVVLAMEVWATEVSATEDLATEDLDTAMIWALALLELHTESARRSKATATTVTNSALFPRAIYKWRYFMKNIKVSI